MNNDEYALTPKGHATSEADQMKAIREHWSVAQCDDYDTVERFMNSPDRAVHDTATAIGASMLLDAYVALGYAVLIVYTP